MTTAEIKPAPDALLTPDDVASILGVNRGTVLKFARDGELGVVKIGKQRRFKRAEVDRFIGQHTEEAA